MKRYFRASIYIIYSIVKFSVIKLFHFSNFKFSVMSLFSPLTEIDINNKATIILGKLIKAKSGTRIKARKSALIEIGDYTSFNHGCMLISHEKIIIGKNVQFGPNVLIYDHDHDFRLENGLKDLKFKTAPVIIGNNVWVGANVVILKGTIIGDNCVIGAGSILKGKFGNNKIIIQKTEIVIKSYLIKE